MELVKTPHSDTPGMADRQSGEVPAMGVTPDGRLPAQYRTAVDLKVLTLCRAVVMWRLQSNFLECFQNGGFDFGPQRLAAL